MIRLPSWFPELDLCLRLWPLVDLDVCAVKRHYQVRWFTITSMSVKALAWRSIWMIDVGFNLYKREER